MHEVGEHRTWGDGANRVREHLIVTLHDCQACGWVQCTCGITVKREAHLSLGVAWNIHRGVADARPTVHEAHLLATDAEVGEFLARANGEQRPVAHLPLARASYPSESVYDDAFRLLERIDAVRAACTCDRAPIYSCPNYIEGDECVEEP